MIHLLGYSLRALRRDARASDVRALFIALCVAVAATTMIGFFLERVESGLERQAGRLLGGDLVLVKGSDFDADTVERLEASGMRLSEQIRSVSMASRDDGFQMVSFKAVDANYPLYGTVIIDRGDGAFDTQGGPPGGSVWVEPRLAQLLDLQLDDQLQLGSRHYRVDAWLVSEPDQQLGFEDLSPRVMIQRADLDDSGLLQPGARLTYRLMAAGDAAQLASLDPQLQRWRDQGIRVLDVREDSPSLGRALERAQQYLSLAGLAAVLLAGVAVAMAIRRYVERHLDAAALARCFGMVQRDLVALFVLQLGWLALAATLVGALLGALGQALLVRLLAAFLPLELPAPGFTPLAMGLLTALAVLIGFAGPTLARLRQVSALKVLRRELEPLPVSGWLALGVATLCFGALLWLYSGELLLSLGVLLGGLVLLAALWGATWVALDLLFYLARWLPSTLRIGARQLALRRRASVGQLVAFSVTFAAMAIISLVRGDVISDWQARLPVDAPNQFAINIQPSQLDAFAGALDGSGESRSDFFPIVRGRLTMINGVTARQAVPEEAREDGNLSREINLTWREEMPPDNQIIAGEWFTVGEGGEPAPISIASDLSERLGIGLGDVLGFDIGGEILDARVTSIREVEWEAFRPNFFVIFPPGELERFGASYITSFYLSAEHQGLLNQLVRDFPSVTLLDIDALLTQLREILAQVSRAVEAILALVLFAGVAVLYAAMIVSHPARAHEGALLRVFGAGDRYLLRVQATEFVLLGVGSGLLGAALAELAAAALYLGWLDLPARPHPLLWLSMPPLGALLIGGIGLLLSRSLRRTAPLESLKLLGEG